MGAWIEILDVTVLGDEMMVAPLVGAWIEMEERIKQLETEKSLPSWERGLKFLRNRRRLYAGRSLPSWERGLKYAKTATGNPINCRSPRGSVD